MFDDADPNDLIDNLDDLSDVDPEAVDAPEGSDRFESTTLEELTAAGAEKRAWTLSNDSRQRLDKYLQNRLKGISRNQIQKLIALDAVTVNGKSVKQSAALRQGDVVEVWVPPKPGVDILPEDIPLDVLFEDDQMIVINKRAGIIVHPARKYKTGTLVNALAYHLKHRSPQAQGQQGQLSDVGRDDQRPGVVHRLDMNTTGVIVFAKQETTHWLLSRQFEYRTNLKCYLALVHGCPDPPQGVIHQPLGKHPTIREAHAVRHDETGRESTTYYRVRRRYRG
ncbi:MAG: RluA family pseudouridine synthase, partial [Algisphaera sp.]